MPGTVITFPVRGAGVAISPLFGPKLSPFFWPKKISQYQSKAWAWLGRAGRLLGADILVVGRPSAPLARAQIPPPPPLFTDFQGLGGHL